MAFLFDRVRRRRKPSPAFVVGLTLTVEEDGNQYASFCKELGTTSCGETAQEAMTSIREAVIVHLNALEECGERERVFREAGIEMEPITVQGEESLEPSVQRMTSLVRVPVHA